MAGNVSLLIDVTPLYSNASALASSFQSQVLEAVSHYCANARRQAMAIRILFTNDILWSNS